MAINPINWLNLAVYGYVRLAARSNAAKRFQAKDYNRWERDDTSRTSGDEDVELVQSLSNS